MQRRRRWSVRGRYGERKEREEYGVKLEGRKAGGGVGREGEGRVNGEGEGVGKEDKGRGEEGVGREGMERRR